jgi:hypothetical protein
MNISQLTYKFGNFFGYQKSNMAATIEIYLKVDVCCIYDHCSYFQSTNQWWADTLDTKD